MFSSHPLFRIFRVVLLFSYQVSLTSYQVFAVRSLVRQRDIYYHTAKSLSTTFFNFFWNSFFIIKSRISNGERGIWTLAPVARPTPLAGAPLQPLEYFSSRRFLYRQQELVYQFVAIMSTIFLNFIAFFYKFILYSISIYNFHSLLQYIDVFLFHFILWCKCK